MTSLQIDIGSDIACVPSFVFGGRYAVTGAQPVDVLRQVLDKVWAELHPSPAVVAEGATCGPEGC